MKVAIYARVSTADGRQETENQLSQLRDFAAKESWTIIREYVDHDSGGKADRKQFRRLFRDAEQRDFDVVLFWALDRFSREGSLETLQHLDKLNQFGVGFRSLTESYLTRAESSKTRLSRSLEQSRSRSGYA